MKKRMTICLLILGTLLQPIDVKANDNFNHNAGFQKFISEIDIDISIDKEYYTIKNHNGFKSYMSYKKITDESSNQYKLQQNSETNENGFRIYNNRYCVAIGTAFNADIGQMFDVELKNGTIIPCIVSDIKANCDTDKTNTFTSQGCCLEFIVDTNNLDKNAKTMGDCSSLCEEWQSPCSQYIIYNITIITKESCEE